MTRLAVLGSGTMGEALMRGLRSSGWGPQDLLACDVRAERLDELRESLGVRGTTDPRKAASSARGVLLAVKPQDAASALEGLGEDLGEEGLVSIVAGLSTERLEELCGGEPSVVRAMPNTPARVGKGVTALSPGRFATDATRGLADEIFSAVGPTVWVGEEHLDTVTAVSGSGPAYVFLFAEALIEAAVAGGLPRDVAETLAYATISGAGEMLQQTGEPPAVLRAQVTSPGGTTAAALQVLEAMAVRAAFGEAVRAARRRARELGS